MKTNRPGAQIAKELSRLGFELFATGSTADYLRQQGLEVRTVMKLNEGRPNVADVIKNREVALVINTPSGRKSHSEGFTIRQAALQHNVPIVTTLAAARAALAGIRGIREGRMTVQSLQDYYAKTEGLESKAVKSAAKAGARGSNSVMANVILRSVTKKINDHVIVNGVNLDIPDREFFVLVGPSGCGKTTTLRMIAGLEEVTSGEVWIGNKLVNGVPPKDRDIAMVFQNYALYPHMTAYENMAFGLKLRGYNKKEIDGRVRESAEILNLTHLLERKPKELSGGQRQRVALGRAIVRKPKVFLFDEPLSNLDAKLRVQMRTELSKLHDRLQTTMIYVTHDQVEAMTMGDRICVMKDGMIMQVDKPLEIYNKPANKFIASFIGSPPMNFMDVQVIRRSGHICLDEGKFVLELLSSMEESVAPMWGKS